MKQLLILFITITAATISSAQEGSQLKKYYVSIINKEEDLIARGALLYSSENSIGLLIKKDTIDISIDNVFVMKINKSSLGKDSFTIGTYTSSQVINRLMEEKHENASEDSMTLKKSPGKKTEVVTKINALTTILKAICISHFRKKSVLPSLLNTQNHV